MNYALNLKKKKKLCLLKGKQGMRVTSHFIT
jgi:hypothetical protein